MPSIENRTNPLAPPDLGQLLAQFLQQRVTAADQGLVPEDAGEVLLHQAAAPVVDPRMAFTEGLEAAAQLLNKSEAAAFQADRVKTPPEWATLVRSQDAPLAVPFCVGNYPQMLRSVTALLSGIPASAQNGHTRPMGLDKPAEWGAKMLGQGRYAEALLAVAALRLAHQFEQAAELLRQVRKNAPAGWKGLLTNEEAALTWQKGDVKAAQRLWESHPEPNSPTVLFNRGMACLFGDKPAEAATLFRQAGDALPETSSWHQLARLYQTVAESR